MPVVGDIADCKDRLYGCIRVHILNEQKNGKKNMKIITGLLSVLMLPVFNLVKIIRLLLKSASISIGIAWLFQQLFKSIHIQYININEFCSNCNTIVYPQLTGNVINHPITHPARVEFFGNNILVNGLSRNLSVNTSSYQYEPATIFPLFFTQMLTSANRRIMP